MIVECRIAVLFDDNDILDYEMFAPAVAELASHGAFRFRRLGPLSTAMMMRQMLSSMRLFWNIMFSLGFIRRLPISVPASGADICHGYHKVVLSVLRGA